MKSNVIAEYKLGKSAYQITKQGFVDQINLNLPGAQAVFPWDKIYAALEFEKVLDARTNLPEPVLRWMRVYQKGGQLLAEMEIPDNLRPSMIKFYELFKSTQKEAQGKNAH